ncbi:MAG TPA: cytochrome c biogenesis protein CcsA [Terriglobales bacterium]|nr:cytochrome c biogenesis protein CcsA [Terriglobales bacterium]
MANIWLRVALALYGLGLLYILVALTRSRKILNSLALHAAYLGMIFHFVAIAETVQQSGELSLASLSLAASILGFLIMVVFLLVYMVYQTTSPGIVAFPVVFLLTFVGLSAQEPVVLTSSVARQGWLIAHISLIFAGYAALVLSFSASLIYLIQENILKSKRPGGLLARLPSLQVTDEIGFRSLLIGFPFMTAGLIAGMVIAQASFGHIDFRDPKILLSVLTWAVYLVLLYTRWNAGWRGRRAAYLAAGVFVTAIVAWAANYFSAIHRLARP